MSGPTVPADELQRQFLCQRWSLSFRCLSRCCNWARVAAICLKSSRPWVCGTVRIQIQRERLSFPAQLCQARQMRTGQRLGVLQTFSLYFLLDFGSTVNLMPVDAGRCQAPACVAGSSGHRNPKPQLGRATHLRRGNELFDQLTAIGQNHAL